MLCDCTTVCMMNYYCIEIISGPESLHGFMQRDYEEFKVRINGLVAMAQKVPEDGWTMQDGTPWPGNNVRDHPGMIQVRGCFLDVVSHIIVHAFICCLVYRYVSLFF